VFATLNYFLPSHFGNSHKTFERICSPCITYKVRPELFRRPFWPFLRHIGTWKDTFSFFLAPVFVLSLSLSRITDRKGTKFIKLIDPTLKKVSLCGFYLRNDFSFIWRDTRRVLLGFAVLHDFLCLMLHRKKVSEWHKTKVIPQSSSHLKIEKISLECFCRYKK
jgi:hypothetical protein